MPNDSGRGSNLTDEERAKGGRHSHQNDSEGSRSMSGSGDSGTQGGTHEQHVKAGEQSHKND